MTEPILALDIGGTKIAAGVVTTDGELLSSARLPTAGAVDADSLWQIVLAVAEKALEDSGVENVIGIGCGSAGPMRWPEGIISPVNLPQWREFPLAERLAANWPDIPVRVHNDAICVAIAEHWKGVAEGYSNVLGMVISTGVGGGIISGNRVINGADGNAGHIGHLVVDPKGPNCVCGGRGCLEAIARGPAAVAWALNQGWFPADDKPATGVTLAEDARGGDQIALEALQRSGRAVGVALASAAALLDLEIAAIGGGIMNAHDIILPAIHETFEEHAHLPFARRMQIKHANSTSNPGIIGAAGLIANADRYWTPPQG